MVYTTRPTIGHFLFPRIGMMPARLIRVECAPCNGTGQRVWRGFWHKCASCAGIGVINGMFKEPKVGDRVVVRSRISPWNGHFGFVLSLTSFRGAEVGYRVKIDEGAVFVYCGADIKTVDTGESNG